MKGYYNIVSCAVPIIVGVSSFLILTLSYRRISIWLRTPNWVEEDFRKYLEKNNQICKKCNSYNRNIINNPDLKCWKCDEPIGQICNLLPQSHNDGLQTPSIKIPLDIDSTEIVDNKERTEQVFENTDKTPLETQKTLEE